MEHRLVTGNQGAQLCTWHEHGMSMREAWQLLWGAHLILGPCLNSWNPADIGPNNSTAGKKGFGLGHSGWCLGHLMVLLAKGLLPSHVATPCDVSTGKGAEVPQLTLSVLDCM